MITSVIYPPKAAPALGHLKSSSNDIEIFVEDSSSANLWVRFLRHFLPNSVKLNSVNLMGGRANVINACRSDQQDDGRRRLYIIDGDFDIIRLKHKPRLKHLYRLRAYCLENYLMQEDALIDVAVTFSSKTDENSARSALDLNGWAGRNDMPLRTLFVTYALAEELPSPPKTVGYSVHRLRDQSKAPFEICPGCSAKRIFQLLRLVRRSCEREDVRCRFDAYSHAIARKTVFDFVSGKDYLVPIFHALMKNKFGMNISKDSMVMMLASKLDARVDPYLKRRLANI